MTIYREHIQHLIEFAALDRKQGISLFASDTKFQIAVTGIGFLGITISNNEIKMEPCMIQKVQRFRRIFVPVSKDFGGAKLCSKSYSDLSSKLQGTEENHEIKPFKWDPKANEEVEALKSGQFIAVLLLYQQMGPQL